MDQKLSKLWSKSPILSFLVTGDGRIDGYDTTGDGKANAFDVTGDGRIDAVDIDGDGKADVFVNVTPNSSENGRSEDETVILNAVTTVQANVRRWQATAKVQKIRTGMQVRQRAAAAGGLDRQREMERVASDLYTKFLQIKDDDGIVDSWHEAFQRHHAGTPANKAQTKRDDTGEGSVDTDRRLSHLERAVEANAAQTTEVLAKLERLGQTVFSTHDAVQSLQKSLAEQQHESARLLLP